MTWINLRLNIELKLSIDISIGPVVSLPIDKIEGNINFSKLWRVRLQSER